MKILASTYLTIESDLHRAQLNYLKTVFNVVVQKLHATAKLGANTVAFETDGHQLWV